MPSLYSVLAGKPYLTPCRAGGKMHLVEPIDTNKMAYAKGIVPGEWERNDRIQAVVSTEVDVQFSPLDHNSDYEASLSGSGMKCDGFIFNQSKHVAVFVELKGRQLVDADLDAIAAACIGVDSSSAISKQDLDYWLPKGVLQLKESVDRFLISDAAECAVVASEHFACLSNRACGYGQEFSAEATKEAFKKATGFPLIITTQIDVKAPPAPLQYRFLNSGMLEEITK